MSDTRTDQELAAELATLETEWDKLAAMLEESGGKAGDPFEDLADRMAAIRAELRRRKGHPETYDKDNEET